MKLGKYECMLFGECPVELYAGLVDMDDHKPVNLDSIREDDYVCIRRYNED